MSEDGGVFSGLDMTWMLVVELTRPLEVDRRISVAWQEDWKSRKGIEVVTLSAFGNPFQVQY